MHPHHPLWVGRKSVFVQHNYCNVKAEDLAIKGGNPLSQGFMHCEEACSNWYSPSFDLSKVDIRRPLKTAGFLRVSRRDTAKNGLPDAWTPCCMCLLQGFSHVVSFGFPLPGSPHVCQLVPSWELSCLCEIVSILPCVLFFQGFPCLAASRGKPNGKKHCFWGVQFHQKTPKWLPEFWTPILHVAMGQNPGYPLVNIPIPTQIGSKMVVAPTNHNGIALVSTTTAI